HRPPQGPRPPAGGHPRRRCQGAHRRQSADGNSRNPSRRWRRSGLLPAHDGRLSPMIRVSNKAFDPAAEITVFTRRVAGSGAVVTFLGQVRGDGPDGAITAMALEHYPGMTERALEGIEAEARRRWPLDDVIIIHRHGRLQP